MSGGLGSTLGIQAGPGTYPAVTLSAQPSTKSPTSEKNLSLGSAVVELADANYLAGLGSANSSDGLIGLVYDATAISTTRTLTLPSATALLALLSEPLVGSSFKFHVVNPSGNTLTVQAGTDGTTLGLMNVLTLTSGEFRVRVTDVATPAYQIQRL